MTEATDFARSRLQSAVASGMQATGPVILSVLDSMPEDEIVPLSHADFDVAGLTPHLNTPAGHSALNDHAFGQLLERAGLPMSFARQLLTPGSGDDDASWRVALLEQNMRTLLAHASGRALVRRLGGTVRGVLSDCYRRLDSRPLLDAFVQASSELGAAPINGFATETRVAIRCVVPTIVEPVPGEALAFGLSWANSDYGAGAYSISSFVLRLVCLNGMVGETALRKVHLGSRLDGSLVYSQRTHALDTRTLVSATQDIVRELLSPSAIEQRCSLIRSAHARELTFAQAWAKVGKQLGSADREAVQEAYEGPDTLNMPAGLTAWRFANALSWVANDSRLPDERRIDLQNLSGRFLGV